MGVFVKRARLVSASVQARALVAATARQLVWGLRAVSGEVRRWRALAARIPDAALRADALAALAEKRGNVDGAALFWTLASVRRPQLLRLLVAYEVMCDFLDSTSERGAAAGLDNGLQLHLAFSEALDPFGPTSDYYRHHPWREDGGYLRGLVESCRAMCVRLPSYPQVRHTLLCAARRAQVQGLNHEPDPCARAAALRAWVEREFGCRELGCPSGLQRLGGPSVEDQSVGDPRRRGKTASRFGSLGLMEPGRSAPGHSSLRHLPHPSQASELQWFELSGSASTWISVLALIGLASNAGRLAKDAVDTYSAYFWVCLAATMLDSYVDEMEDLTRGDHSYFRHYPSREHGVRRAGEIVARATCEARALRDGDRHSVIVACMVALYLSKDSALTPDTVASSRSMLRAGGRLAELLWPVLRGWRRAYALRGA